MKIRTILAVLGFVSVNSITYAAVSDSETVKQLTQQTQLLQQQLEQVKSQLAKLQPTHKSKKHRAKKTHRPKHTPVVMPVAEKATLDVGTVANERDPQSTPDWLYTRGTPMVTAPYLGVDSEFDASDLIVNSSSINKDLSVLKQRSKLEKTIKEESLNAVDHPFLQVTGKVEGQFIGQNPYVGHGSSDFDLSTAELEVVANMDAWLFGFIGLDYDNSPPASSVSNWRFSNSRVFLNKGFVTVGNLNRFPLYATLGQQYLPFGRYSSSMINQTLPQQLARTNARALLLGYHGPESTSVYSSLFAFKGDSQSNTGSRINNIGGDIGYKYKKDVFGFDVGASYLNNIADSIGFQSGGNVFAGFSAPASSEVLVHRVPAFDLHGSLTVDRYVFIGEYVGATTAFDPNNLMFNGLGAKPTAINVEGAYLFTMLDKPSTIALTYGNTSQAMALGLPKHRYAATLNTSWWRDTIESLEYKHEVNYSASDIALGTNSGVINQSNDPTLGKSRDIITAQLGVYF